MEKTKQLSKTTLITLFLSISAMIAAVTAVYGYRQTWWTHLDAFSIFAYATYLAVFTLVLFFIGVQKIRNGKKGLRFNLLSLVFSLPIIFSTFMFEYTASIYPKINDISTDTANPPSFWDMPNAFEYPSKNAKIQEEFYPYIKPLELNSTKQEVFDKVLKIVQNNKWELITSDIEEGQIEAIALSFAFAFKDEIAIAIKEQDDKIIVNVRSRSRLGKIDRGANAKRIKNLLDDLKK